MLIYGFQPFINMFVLSEASVFAQTLAGTMKKDAFYANVRKFDNSLEASVFDENSFK